jgi:hypothetical protein
VRFWSYPFGRWSMEVRAHIEAAGFVGACTILPGRNDFRQDRFLLKRNLILPGAGRWRFLAALHR